MAKVDSFNKGIKNAEAGAFQAEIKKSNQAEKKNPKERKPINVMVAMGLSKTASVEK